MDKIFSLFKSFKKLFFQKEETVERVEKNDKFVVNVNILLINHINSTERCNCQPKEKK